jgi:hypothetical protein
MLSSHELTSSRKRKYSLPETGAREVLRFQGWDPRTLKSRNGIHQRSYSFDLQKLVDQQRHDADFQELKLLQEKILGIEKNLAETDQALLDVDQALLDNTVQLSRTNDKLRKLQSELNKISVLYLSSY